MKRFLILALVIFMLALMVSSVSATIKPNPPIPTNKVSVMDSVRGDAIISVGVDNGDVTVETIKPDKPITR